MRENGGTHTAVVLDEHPLWLDAMERLLVSLELDVVGKATSVSAALEMVGEHRPDVFVIDDGVGEGSEDALACIREARSIDGDLKIVMLGHEARREDIDAAFAAGAAVYCVKTAQPDDLASAVRQAFDRSIYVALAGGAAPAAPRASAEATADLTRRELEILQLVSEGYSNSQLAKMLWVTEQTVKFHLSNIYRKLDVANRTEASRWAQVHGLLPAAREPLVAA